MLVGEPRFELHASRAHITSPPNTRMACPVTASEPGRHSHSTAFATSSGRTSRCCGLRWVSAARASASLFQVFETMFEIASRTMSVSV